MISFFKTLTTKAAKKKNDTNKQKQKTDCVDGKETQKLKEDKSVAKTSSAKTQKCESRKQLNTKPKKIELVGNYLKNVDNQMKESVPVKPIRRKSASTAKKLNEMMAKKSDSKTSEAIGL